MADLHSTRRKAKSTSRPRNRAATTLTRARRYKTSSSTRAQRPLTHARRTSNTQLIPQLREIAQRFRVVYSSCVTTQLALQAQNADQDHDILCALRTKVSEPVGRQLERLDALVVEFGHSLS